MSIRHLIPEYTEPEQIIYNDQYKLSLYSIVSKYRPTSSKQMQELLDSNGYYARAKVREVYSDGHRMFQFRIRVSMIWSNYTYHWPFKGVYSYRNHMVERLYNVKPVDIYTEDILDNLFDSYGYSIQNHTRGKLVPKRSEMNVKELLTETRVMGADGFLIKTLSDLKEYKENVIGII